MAPHILVQRCRYIKLVGRSVVLVDVYSIVTVLKRGLTVEVEPFAGVPPVHSCGENRASIAALAIVTDSLKLAFCVVVNGIRITILTGQIKACCITRQPIACGLPCQAQTQGAVIYLIGLTVEVFVQEETVVMVVICRD